MTEHVDLGLKRLICTNSCALLKIAKKWCALCKNDKTCSSRREIVFLLKLAYFAENRIRVVCPVQHGDNKTCSRRAESLYSTNPCTLLKIAKKWCVHYKNDKTCSSRAENAVLHKLVHFAENNLRVVRPVRK